MSLGLFIIIFVINLFSVSGQKLDQEISFTKKKDQSVSFSCKNTNQCGTYIFWYQKKEGEPFTVILNIKKNDGAVDASYNHPQKDDFSASRKENQCDLRIQSVKDYHSATYYCACYQSGQKVKVFGPGTRLYVMGSYQVERPKVTVYPASTPESDGKTILLCLARDMSPDLVKISWKMEDGSGQKVDVPQREKEELEQIEKGQTTSMIIIDKRNADTNKYSCSVKHEKGTQAVDIPKEKPAEVPPTVMVAPACHSRNHTKGPVTLEVADDFFQSMFSLNLASLTYTVMIVKSLVYSCGLAVLHRNMESRPRTQ